MKTHPAPSLFSAWLGLLLGLVSALPAAEFTCTVTGKKAGEAVPEAAVSLIPLDRPAPPLSSEAKAEVAQEGQEFYAFMTIVQEGTKVVFPNRDTVQHHVYSLSKTKKFELPLYNPGQAESIVFETAGQVALGCNIHDWMIAYLVVVPTPWFAKTDIHGAARVTAPPGRYRVEVWHPRMARAETREITLADDAPVQETFAPVLKPDRRIRRGLGGKTGGY